MIEHEVKILDVDPDFAEQVILELGGRKVTDTRLMRRYVYDIDPNDASRWVRLRDDGEKITLTTKQIIHNGIDGVIEHEIEVSDFEATNTLLGALGFFSKAYQENSRASYVLDGARVELDRWPMLPPYLEVEADTAEDVTRVAEMLSQGDHAQTTDNTTAVYARYGINLAEITDLRF